MDEATARLMADKGVWLSIQPFLGDDNSICLTGQSRIDQLQVIAGTDQAYRLAKAHENQNGIRLGLAVLRGADTRQGVMLTHLTRWYTPAEVLTMATAANGELLAAIRSAQSVSRKAGRVERRCAC